MQGLGDLGNNGVEGFGNFWIKGLWDWGIWVRGN